MKKLLLIFIAAFMMLSLAVYAEDDGKVTVLVDGKNVETDVSAKIEDGRTLVPIRAISDALGAEVNWDEAERFVTLVKGDITVKLVIDSNIMIKNGEEIILDVPAKIENGRTLVPLRAVSEAYGCSVKWNGDAYVVIIISDPDKVEVVKIGELSIPVSYFNLEMYNTSYDLAIANNMTMADIEAIWNNAGNEVKYQTLNSIALKKLCRIIADEQKITFDDGEKASVDEEIKNFKEFLDSSKGYEKALSEAMITPSTVEESFHDTMYREIVIDKLTKKYAVESNDDEKKLVRAKHILVMPNDDRDDEATKKLAEDILKRVKKGEDFDKLIEEYGEDPGMAQNPSGYVFTYGEMVPEFEEAAFSLKDDKISDIVKTDYGYHIIKRVKLSSNDDEKEEVNEKLNEMLQQKIYGELNERMSEFDTSLNQELIEYMPFINLMN